MSKAEERRRLGCPQAYRDSAGRVLCKAVGTLCANQRYCGMIGLWVENEFAKDCLMRNGKPTAKAAEDAPKKKTTKKRGG